MKKTPITILTPHDPITGRPGSRVVEAYVVGNWAAHLEQCTADRDWVGTGRHWHITCVASGMCVPHDYTFMFNRSAALSAIRMLDTKIGSKRITRAIGKRIAALLLQTAREAP